MWFKNDKWLDLCSIEIGQDLHSESIKIMLMNCERLCYSLFEFYQDEISFTELEFIGLTEEKAHRLRFEKDVKYLQS